MNRIIDINLLNKYKEFFSSDSFCCTMHISSSKYSHEQILEILSKFVKGKLNKYLIGRNYSKKNSKDLIQFFWFKEGIDIFNSQVRGFYKGSSFIEENFRMKSTEVQRHYHVLIKQPEIIKNTEHCLVNFRNDIPTLIEMQLKRIVQEFNSKNDKKLDVLIRNNPHYDKSQQFYATKEFGRKDYIENWGIL